MLVFYLPRVNMYHKITTKKPFILHTRTFTLEFNPYRTVHRRTRILAHCRHKWDNEFEKLGHLRYFSNEIVSNAM